MAFDKARVLQILRPAFALLPEVQKPDRKVTHLSLNLVLFSAIHSF